MPFKPTATLLKKTSPSSTQWLARQYRDPYVRARLSDPLNYRSRSAFKLLDVEARHEFLKRFFKEADAGSFERDSSQEYVRRRGARRVFNIVDLGAAPGGWSQVIAGKMGLLEEETLVTRKLTPTTSKGLKTPRRSPKDAKGQHPSSQSDVAAYDELGEMEKYFDSNGSSDWSISKRSHRSAARKPVLRPQFEMMDPLDYLNGREPTPDPSESPLEPRSRPTSHNLPVNLIALDILPILPIPGVHTLQMDFLAPQAADELTALLDRLNGPLAHEKEGVATEHASHASRT